MKVEENVLFQYLRSSLWGTELADIPADTDLRKVLKTAKKMSVFQLTADAILRDKKISLTKEQIKYIHKKLHPYYFSYKYISTLLCQLLDYLGENGIHPVLLKGIGISVLYREPRLRDCGDIDLYVDRDNYKRAIELCLKKSDNETAAEDEKHFHLCINEVVVEIHRFSLILIDKKLNKIYSEYENSYIRDSINTISINGRKVSIPETTFNLLFIFLHAYQHFMSRGLGLRQLCDIAVYLDRNFTEIDSARLGEMLGSLNLLNAWQLFMSVLVDYIGLNRNKTIFYTNISPHKGRRMIQLILSEGSFGYYDKESYIIHKYSISRKLILKVMGFYFHTKRYIKLLGILPEYVPKEYVAFLKLGFEEI